MTIQQAVKKAVEVGYEIVPSVCGNNHCDEVYSLTDPLFWQSLGKAMGWGREAGYGDDYMEGWKYSWFCFIDHLAEGKDAESFFETL